MKILVIIPARGGSKGLKGKNIKKLSGKPLITYSIDVARSIFSDDDICVSTDDEEIIKVVEDYSLHVPFKRPDYLAQDKSGTHEVILNALEFYEKKGKEYEYILLMQPTSPFRCKKNIEEIIDAMKNNNDAEMVVSVKESKENPYFNLFEENDKGILKKSKEGSFHRRQDCPKVYAYNGSLYLMRVNAIKKKKIDELENIIKYIMEDEYSIDIDTKFDWDLAEYFYDKNNGKEKR